MGQVEGAPLSRALRFGLPCLCTTTPTRPPRPKPCYQSQVHGSGFQFPGFGFQFWSFGHRVPGFGSRVSGFKVRVDLSRARCRVAVGRRERRGEACRILPRKQAQNFPKPRLGFLKTSPRFPKTSPRCPKTSPRIPRTNPGFRKTSGNLSRARGRGAVGRRERRGEACRVPSRERSCTTVVHVMGVVNP